MVLQEQNAINQLSITKFNNLQQDTVMVAYWH